MQLQLESMTLEQKLGFVMCARLFSRNVTEKDIQDTIEMIKKRAVGCVQIPTQNTELVKRIRAAADYPILIINDAEQGFPASSLPKVQQMTLAASNDLDAIRAFAKGIVHDAQEAGFNAVWGPLLDVLRCDGPCKVHRVFSDNPDVVSQYAQVINEVMTENHFISTGKHYPGQGGMVTDTHVGPDLINATEDELLAFDLKPYLHLMERGLLPAIMSTHSTFPRIDPEYPASLSKKVIDILRKQGFDGICFTDSFAMMSILQQYGEDNIYGMALAAGNDIILPNYRTSYRKAMEILEKNYRSGAFTEERLNEAVRRILAAQAFVAGQDGICPFTKADMKALERVAEKAITAVTDPGLTAALPQQKNRLFVVMTENDFDPDAGNNEISTGKWYHPRKVADAIHANFPDAGVHFFPEYPTGRDIETMLTAATEYPEVIFVTFCTTSAYTSTDCLTRRAEATINALIRSGKVSAVVHFGNPFAMQNIHHIPRRIFGYMMEASQQYAIEVLAGKRSAPGKLPFQITFD